MSRMSLRKFGGIVRRAIEGLPAKLHRHLENVVVDVELEPDRKALRDVYTEDEIADGAGMYGLFSPLPMIAAEGMDFDEPPHRLVIYKRPLEDDFPDPKELVTEIRKTVVHELSHHFGYTDADLEKWDATADPFAEKLIEKETAVHLARLRLASLWVSQTARAIADNALRMFVVLLIAGNGGRLSEGAWYQVTPFYLLPFIFFAPINGAIANSLPKRHVLVAACGYSTAIALVLGWFVPATPDYAWWWCVGVGLNMLGTAFYSPTRYAMLPAIAQDAHIPLPRVNGWIEMGCAVGIVGGLLLGVQLAPESWNGVPAVLLLIAMLNGIGLVTAIPAEFALDVVRPESPGRAVVDFFGDFKRIWNDRIARASMLGLASLMALVLTGSGAIMVYKGVFAPNADQGLLQHCLLLIALGSGLGSFLASLQGHPYRTMGLVPIGVLGLLAAMVWVVADSDPRWPMLLLGLAGGLANVPLRAVYQAEVPADARGNAMAVSNTAERLMQITLAILLLALVHFASLSPLGQMIALLVLAAIYVAVACWALLRPALEQFIEIILWPIFRFHFYGPGLDKVPLNGPVLVVANHTAWFDPLWLAKVLPRKVIPMMTSDFYDLPVMRTLMRRVIGAIRVQAATFRREAPELDEAIAALDRGECVVLFPEGLLRRRAEPHVRYFGRGVWHILRQRPNTPVVVCWVEGGWGSFTSYDKGPPTKNKRPDFWCPIGIAVTEPEVLPAEILADNRATRRHLMERCVNARGLMGLEVPALDTERDEKAEAETNE
jgi:1-acyl-sn-glycerol-3-phosphate acyltransferase/predicted Zn-dependent protease with MMP-like domain